jgi:hypothetical protein
MGQRHSANVEEDSAWYFLREAVLGEEERIGRKEEVKSSSLKQRCLDQPSSTSQQEEWGGMGRGAGLGYNYNYMYLHYSATDLINAKDLHRDLRGMIKTACSYHQLWPIDGMYLPLRDSI